MRYSLFLGLLIGLLSAPASARSPVWNYVIDAPGDAAVLHVMATMEALDTTEISVNDGAEPYVSNVEIATGAHWQKLSPQGTSWQVPTSAVHGCRIRYDYALGKAAATVHNSDTASNHEGILQASPGVFLLRPVRGAEGTVRFKVHTTGSTRFVTGIQSTGNETWEARASDLFLGPDCAFGPLSVTSLTIGKCRLEVAWKAHALALDDAQVKQWLTSKLTAVVAYFGRLPLPQGLILIVPIAQDDIQGHAAGGSGFSVMVSVGKTVTATELMQDWTFTHEMVHVCTPSMPGRQHWMEEGIATYLEPIIRVRAGDLTPQKVWHDMVDGLPKGQPASGDRGLNHTHTWGRTYWGGCMFWFLADLQIREATHDRKSLRDALVAMLEKGGSIATQWEPEQVLAIGDQASGTQVFHTLFARLGNAPETIDLKALWSKLGIAMEGDKVIFSSAPESSIREAMTQK